MPEVEPSLENHEIRIYKLEQSNESIQKNIAELKDSVLVNQAKSAGWPGLARHGKRSGA